MSDERMQLSRRRAQARTAEAVVDEAGLRELVTQIQAQVNAALDDRRSSGVVMGQQQRDALVEEILADWLRRDAEIRIRQDAHALPTQVVEQIRALVRMAASPLGPLAPFLDNSAWSDVQVNGARNVVCTERGSENRQEYRSPLRRTKRCSPGLRSRRHSSAGVSMSPARRCGSGCPAGCGCTR